jgi:hypothetical protein
MNKADIARESKKLANNDNSRLQVTRKKNGRGYNTYLTYKNEWFKDDADEETIGFISYPMTLKQVKEWFELVVR